MATYEQRTTSPFSGIDVGDFSDPVFADVDGDGLLDLVTGERNNALTYYRNTGSATSPIYTQQTGASNPFNGLNAGIFGSPTFTDVNGDGLADLVVGNHDGVINYYKNTGSASSPTYTQQTGGNNPFSAIDVGRFSTPAFVDVDNDGKLDVVVGSFSEGLKYYKNTGSTTAPVYSEQTGSSNPFSGITFGNRVAPTFANVNGDGTIDLVVSGADGRVDYYQNTGSASSPVYSKQTGSSNPFESIDVGDVGRPTFTDGDGDGDLDFVVGNKDGLLSYFENTTPSVDTVVSQISGKLTISDANGANSNDSLTLTEAAGKITVSDPFQELSASGDATSVDSHTVEVNASVLTSPIEINLADGDNFVSAETVTRGLKITGGSGYSVIRGGSGNDEIKGGSGKNKIEGGAGADFLDGEGGNDDTVEYTNSTAGVNVSLLTSKAKGGHAQGDTIANFENISGSAFDDNLTGDNGKTILRGRAGNDTLIGADGDDRLFGDEGDDVIVGGFGNDYMRGGAGADFLNGGAGIDTIYYLASDSGVTVDLNASTFVGGHAQGDRARGVENIHGSNFNDSLTGTNVSNGISGREGNDTIRGLSGNDNLRGNEGDDVLIGGIGGDVLLGGEGADEFRLESLRDSVIRGQGGDRIEDLNIGQDTISSVSAVAASDVKQLGSVANLSEANLQNLLTEADFQANLAATFSLGSRTFVALNDGIDGFVARTDALIDITGFMGDLSQLSIAAA